MSKCVRKWKKNYLTFCLSHFVKCMSKFLTSKTSVILSSFDAVANIKYVLRLLIVSGTMGEYMHVFGEYMTSFGSRAKHCPARIREEVKYSSM